MREKAAAWRKIQADKEDGGSASDHEEPEEEEEEEESQKDADEDSTAGDKRDYAKARKFARQLPHSMT